MRAVAVPPDDGFAAFRDAARRLLAAGIPPPDVAWTDAPGTSLFAGAPPGDAAPATVPRTYVALAEAVACHRDPDRWPLLYEALWRITRNERALLDVASDPLVHRLRRMQAAVRRDQHRMTAFVRFRSVPHGTEEHFIAWYEPAHRVLRRASGFFIDRFANMRFSVLTPDLALHWDRTQAVFAPGLTRGDAASGDAVEAWWQGYYAAIFNPARANGALVKRHMPARYWRDLPEAKIIAGLLRDAGPRTQRMTEGPGSKPRPVEP
jgi:DNA polymerase